MHPIGDSSHDRKADIGHDRKTDIGAAFGAAVRHYDANATVQRQVAKALAERAAQGRHADRPRILEIGCGTGLLTREIRARWPEAELIATDLAPEMLRAAASLDLADQVLPMDGEALAFAAGTFDLILSSLSFQWFSDMPGAIAHMVRLLRPGGSLHFSTMGEESFAQWKTAHHDCGVDHGIAPYPSLAHLQEMLAAYPANASSEQYLTVPVRGGAALIRHFRGLGAQVPRAGYQSLGPSAMRRVMRAFDAAGGATDYHILYGTVRHDD